jgi:Na+/proline symporter
MPTWSLFLIGFGVVVLLAGLVYVVWRWGSKKAELTSTILGLLSGVLSVIKEFFKDNPDKLDAHDFIEAAGEIAEVLSAILKKQQAGVTVDAVKEEMTAAVKSVVNKFPGLKDAISDELIEKEVGAVVAVLLK